MDTIYINTDGGARNNPGPAGVGVVFYDKDGKVLHEFKEYIGEATNNQAEYRAIIKALEILLKSRWFKEHNGSSGAEIICRLDSQLVVEQINGNYKVKNEGIIPLLQEVKTHLDKIEIDISFVLIPREQNKLADKLVNNALNTELKAEK